MGYGDEIQKKKSVNSEMDRRVFGGGRQEERSVLQKKGSLGARNFLRTLVAVYSAPPSPPDEGHDQRPRNPRSLESMEGGRNSVYSLY